MAHDANRDSRRRRIELPSGKVVEVFKPRPACPPRPPCGDEAASVSARAGEARGHVAAEPHVCPACESELVYPVAWRSAPADHWEADLRCPNCELRETVKLEQAAAERFDEELKRGAERVKTDLGRLTEANMSAFCDRFAAALEADAIQPIDF